MKDYLLIVTSKVYGKVVIENNILNFRLDSIYDSIKHYTVDSLTEAINITKACKKLDEQSSSVAATTFQLFKLNIYQSKWEEFSHPSGKSIEQLADEIVEIKYDENIIWNYKLNNSYTGAYIKEWCEYNINNVNSMHKDIARNIYNKYWKRNDDDTKIPNNLVVFYVKKRGRENEESNYLLVRKEKV